MGYKVVMGWDQNLRESTVDLITPFSICMKCEIRDWHICLILAILSEKLACVISREIDKSLRKRA